ncbi:PTS sugar transporter subunit IIA [Geobacter pelophilus]|jgi:PTS system mannose-specific IIA component|uniref:PTS sugar transporter subunit IIA n=1 Tax=Geoanaerobacter pelophilus TaxID=60036 RepID=A0AAW4L5E9_9BACT|nr:PTS sugar transporter subunit IIA [Geoanaerobacter pelophilus]MBT0663264.1 PTS sugar transporter subunit IIA [Geoanaerobacter pelophilus]
MIGLVIVTHAGLARELLAAAEMIVGPIEKAEAVGINPGEPVDAIRSSIEKAFASVNSEEILLMTDMFGGTPSNMSLSFLEENRVEVLTGVNLPMLIKFFSDRSRFGIAELAAQIKECGRESISVAGDYLR